MSTLHKQNFDLKLELFHRRKRQTTLEETVEELEAQKAKMEQTNDQLVQELEKRDKALEEAVQMIISLEARNELLLREREMVRQLEADNSLISQLTQSPSTTLVNHRTTPQPQDSPLPTGNQHLARMPSFVSERTENTENLRNVYLDTQTNFSNLSKTDSRRGNTGFVSPSMSILSESSFLSIYGQKAAPSNSPPPNIPRNTHNRVEINGQRSVSMPIRRFAPHKSQRTDHPGDLDDAKRLVETTDTTSSLHKLEKLEELDMTTPTKQGAPQTILSRKEGDRPTTVRPAKPQPMLGARNSKEHASPAHKILSEESFLNQHALPPTPDTMTGSMIGRSQNLNDSPPRDGAAGEHRYPALPCLTLQQTDQSEGGHWRFKPADVGHPPSITAFTGLHDVPGAAYYENRLSTLRRPRSADETTISRHKTDWDSCSDDDDEDDETCSEASSFDYWMREGLRPSQGGASTKQIRSVSTQIRSSRNPPDLFAFSSDANRWQDHGMFGSLGGDGHVSVSTMDALGASLPPPETGLFGSGLAGTSSPRATSTALVAPPAPYRRSSLHARTSAPGTPTTARFPSAHGKHHDSEPHRKRSVSGQIPTSPNPNGWPTPNARSRTPTQPFRPQNQKPIEKRHYPPQVSHAQAAVRPRSRGITSLFRRSLGSTTIQPQPSASVPVTQSPFSPPTQRDDAAPTLEATSWERRIGLVNDLDSATPPPIMRNRAPVTAVDTRDDGEAQRNRATGSSRTGRGNYADAGTPGLGAGLSAVLDGQEGGASLTTSMKEISGQENAQAQNSQGHGRKWFGLGRATSHKTGGT